MKILLLNPKPKSTVKKGATMFKRRKRAKSTVAKRRKNPRAVATVRAAAPARRSIRRRARTAVASVARRTRRRMSSLGGTARGLVPSAKRTIMQGGIAGLGAVGADIVAGQIMKYLPDSLKTAQMQPLAQVAVSLLAGFAISKVNKQAGDAIAVGGVTVATYNLAKSMMKAAGVPGLSAYSRLNGYDYDPSYGMNEYTPLRSTQSSNPLSEYVNGGQMNGMFDTDAFGVGMYDNSFSY